MAEEFHRDYLTAVSTSIIVFWPRVLPPSCFIHTLALTTMSRRQTGRPGKELKQSLLVPELLELLVRPNPHIELGSQQLEDRNALFKNTIERYVASNKANTTKKRETEIQRASKERDGIKTVQRHIEAAKVQEVALVKRPCQRDYARQT